MKKCIFFFAIGVFLFSLEGSSADNDDSQDNLPTFETQLLQGDASDSRQIEDIVKTLAQKVPLDYQDKVAIQKIIRIYRSERVRTFTVALTLGFINGSAATYSLIVGGGANLGQAIPVGIVLGSFCTIGRIFSNKYLDFINGGKSKIENLLRFFGVEFAFITLTKLTSVATGISTLISPLQSLGEIFLTSGLGTLNQGAFDLAIAEKKNTELLTLNTESKKKLVKFHSVLKSALISVASVVIGVTSVNHVQHAKALLIGFSVMGITYYLKTFYSSRCRDLFTKTQSNKED